MDLRKVILLGPIYFLSYTYYWWMSFYKGIISKFYNDRHFSYNKGVSEKRILLIALYQKGVIREDLVAFLRQAKDLGFYVVAVNTLKLSNPNEYKNTIDHYIERYNYGRDFGSYKAGFNFVYSSSFLEHSQRLIIANDSVFYTSKGLKKFILDLTETDKDVLGSTENFELSYHLGSFLISISGNVLRDGRLKKFWKKYRLSDLRPVVIKKGEMKLSSVLKKCASSDQSFCALYSAARFYRGLQSKELIDFSLTHFRKQKKLVPWSTVSSKDVYKEVLERNFISPIFLSVSGEKKSPEVIIELKDLTKYPYIPSDEDALYHFFQSSAQIEIPRNVLRTVIVSLLYDSFRKGSQIHQNAAILLYMGLPIVKMDGVYRGAWSAEDVEQIVKQIDDEEERYRLSALLLKKPYGVDVLEGIEKAGFMIGII